MRFAQFIVNGPNFRVPGKAVQEISKPIQCQGYTEKVILIVFDCS